MGKINQLQNYFLSAAVLPSFTDSISLTEVLILTASGTQFGVVDSEHLSENSYNAGHRLALGHTRSYAWSNISPHQTSPPQKERRSVEIWLKSDAREAYDGDRYMDMDMET